MNINRLLLLFLIAGSGFFAAGCSKEAITPLNSEVSSVQARAELNGAIAHSPFFDDSKQGESGDTSSRSDYSVRGPESVNKQNWYRKLEWPDTARNVELVSLDTEKGLAEVRVEYSLPGRLRIASSWWNLWQGTYLGEKSFTHYNYRGAKFFRREGSWYLSEVTPLKSSPYAAGTTPALNIIQVSVYNNTSGSLLFRFSDPSAYYTRESLPRLASGSTVRVEVETSSMAGSTNICYIHHWLYRDLANDDGTGGDTTAGDKIYTRIYTIGYNTGVHNVFFDVVDKRTLDLPSVLTNYRSMVWAIPYIVE